MDMQSKASLGCKGIESDSRVASQGKVTDYREFLTNHRLALEIWDGVKSCNLLVSISPYQGLSRGRLLLCLLTQVAVASMSRYIKILRICNFNVTQAYYVLS